MRISPNAVAVACTFLALGAWAQVPAPELPRGQVVARVVCAGDVSHAYALYLPSTYTPERKWPVIVCFDPGGAGERPVHLLEKAAEAYGYILMGSWESRNGPLQPIVDAQNALWKEAKARYAVDETRCYAAGFSGGARASIRMALDHPKAFAGVLCCGAFVPGDRSLPRSLPFAVYATVGTEDFNLFELCQGDRDMARGGTTHWVEVFPGPHRWAPPELLREGVEFFQVCAMRKGQVAGDPAWQEGLVKARLASADSLKSSGALLSALWKYRQTGAFFAGIPGAERGTEAATALAQDPRVKAMLETEAKLEAALDRLRHCENLEDYQKEFAALEKMGQAEGYDGARARYALTVSAQDLTASGVMSLQRGNYKSAAALLELASKADPHDPLPPYDAACAYSRLNQRKEALALLGKAVDLGFKDAKLMKNDPDLANIRKDPGFEALLARLEQPAGK